MDFVVIDRDRESWEGN